MFNAIVGNPPYQQEHQHTRQQGETNVSSVFHNFQDIADVVSSMSSLIYPGERWLLRIGRYMDEFGKKQMNSPCLHKVLLYADSRDVFDGVWVSGGVAIVLKNSNVQNDGKWTLQREENNNVSSGLISLPGDRKISTHPLLNSVIEKMDQISWKKRLSDEVRTQKFFRILSDAVETNPEKFVLCNDDFTNKPESFDLRILTNGKAGKTGKAAWFWTSKDTVKGGFKELEQWKIIISSANLTGQNGRTPNAEIIPPGTAVGRVRLVIAAFDTEQEAINCFRFLKTDIIRVLMTTTGNYITGFGNNVKMSDNFLDNESELDFTEENTSLNDQLFNLLQLTEDERMTVREISSSLTPFSRFAY